MPKMFSQTGSVDNRIWEIIPYNTQPRHCGRAWCAAELSRKTVSAAVSFGRDTGRDWLAVQRGYYWGNLLHGAVAGVLLQHLYLGYHYSSLVTEQVLDYAFRLH